MTAGTAMEACAGEPCQSYRPGHNMHVIHAQRIGQSPWGWRDALVTAVEGRIARLCSLDADARPVLWHHRTLCEHVRPGDPVRLHERYHALGCPGGWFNVVVVEAGLGAVPEPADPTAWRGQRTAAVVDLATGLALPLDHLPDPGR